MTGESIGTLTLRASKKEKGRLQRVIAAISEYHPQLRIVAREVESDDIEIECLSIKHTDAGLPDDGLLYDKLVALIERTH